MGNGMRNVTEKLLCVVGKSLERIELFVFNIILTIAVIALLIKDIFPSYVPVCIQHMSLGALLNNLQISLIHQTNNTFYAIL
jgi:Mg2+/citrate symporter